MVQTGMENLPAREERKLKWNEIQDDSVDSVDESPKRTKHAESTGEVKLNSGPWPDYANDEMKLWDESDSDMDDSKNCTLDLVDEEKVAQGAVVSESVVESEVVSERVSESVQVPEPVQVLKEPRYVIVEESPKPLKPARPFKEFSIVKTPRRRR